jgi:hypothetical protein
MPRSVRPELSAENRYDRIPSAFTELIAYRRHGILVPGAAIEGRDPLCRTPFRIGETASACPEPIEVATSYVWDARTGRRDPA